MQNIIVEPKREIQVIAKTQVFIIGSGPAGLAAALASARCGVKTMLIERFGCFGGNITQVGVESIAWYRHEHTQDCSGIGIEFEQRAIKEGFARKEPQSDSYVIDPEGFKVIADKILEEANVDVLLHALVVDAIVEKNVIRGIIFESKSGRQAIIAEKIIDCTGDADVAVRAGVPYTKSKREDLMGVSVMFHCVGIDVPKFQEFVRKSLKPTYADWGKNWSVKTSGNEDSLFSPYLKDIFTNAAKKGIIPSDLEHLSGTWSTFTEFGEACSLNLTYSSGYDCTEVIDLTKAEIEGRHQAIHIIRALRKCVPGFENARLRNFGMTLGTRESRKIIGETEVTKEYVLNQGRCKESIGIFPEFIDGNGYLILPLTGRYYQIPYGCLIPKKIENLLVAGRCVSTDDIAHGSMRNMMCCAVTGQAAGTAAAISVKKDVYPRSLEIKLLQEALIKQKVRIL